MFNKILLLIPFLFLQFSGSTLAEASTEREVEKVRLLESAFVLLGLTYLLDYHIERVYP